MYLHIINYKYIQNLNIKFSRNRELAKDSNKRNLGTYDSPEIGSLRMISGGVWSLRKNPHSYD